MQIPAENTASELRANLPVAPLPLAVVEREHVLGVLQALHGNRTKAAKVLNIGLRTLQLKLKKWKEQGVLSCSPAAK